MKERIREIMSDAALSQQDFAARLGISPATLSSILNGRTNPTTNIVLAVHHAFPQININWLMFGEGSMTAESFGFDSIGNSVPDNLDERHENDRNGRFSQVQASSNSGNPSEPFSADSGNEYAVGSDLFSRASSEDNASGQTYRQSVATPRAPQPSGQRLTPGHATAFQVEHTQKSANIIDMPRREIREIRVFFSDGTYETFGPSVDSAVRNKK